jgi:hypothetical protein
MKKVSFVYAVLFLPGQENEISTCDEIPVIKVSNLNLTREQFSLLPFSP